jgi:hypothetical protein
MKSLTLLLLLLTVISAHARNVDLSTVPQRATVQLTIYNAEDLTLVRETRRISFKPGVNPLQFSWANTLIDPTSVELQFLDHQAELEVIDTTFPHDKPQMLYWNVSSEISGEAYVEITYFTSGISWQADYSAISDAEEKHLRLESFVRVANHSGEAYEDAQVRLVVGTLNLVEKIAELANISVAQTGRMERRDFSQYKQRAAKSMMTAEGLAAAPAPMMDMAQEVAAPKEIAKDSLSEYFIYTIEGTETIPDGWAKRLRSFDAGEVPFDIQYRYRPREYGSQLVRMYLLKNDEESGLGATPLPDGTIRIFRDNGKGGLSYVAHQNLKYVPIGDKIELNLGQDPHVIFEWIKLKVSRDDIWLRLRGPNVYRKIGGGLDVDLQGTVAGWNERALYTQRIRNYSGKPIEVEIRRSFDGDILFRSQLKPKLHDYRSVELTTIVAPGTTENLYHEVVSREGYNHKKNNVTLETAVVAPR